MSSINILQKRDGAIKTTAASVLLEDRTVFVSGSVSSEMALDINSQLLYLEKQSPSEPIKMVIDSPGGSVIAGMSIVDTMDNISCEVHTECLGMAASMGSILFMNGTKGHRLINKFSRVLLHQPLISGSISGQATDLAIHGENILKTRETLYQFIVEKTGQDIKKVEKDCDRDFWINAEESIAYGVCDGMVQSRKPKTTVKTSTTNTSKKKAK